MFHNAVLLKLLKKHPTKKCTFLKVPLWYKCLYVYVVFLICFNV